MKYSRTERELSWEGRGDDIVRRSDAACEGWVREEVKMRWASGGISTFE